MKMNLRNEKKSDLVILNKKHFKNDGSFFKFIGNNELLNGKNIHIDMDGSFSFPFLNLTGRLTFTENKNKILPRLKCEGDLVCESIEETRYINAKNINVYYSLQCGTLEIHNNISCYHGIHSTNYIIAGGNIEVEFGSIEADGLVEAAGNIVVSENICSKQLISGENIICSGIRTLENITCRLYLECHNNILAGTKPGEMDLKESIIACGKLINGKVLCGTLVEIGLPKEDKNFHMKYEMYNW